MDLLVMNPFFHTVEGIEFPASCELSDGRLVARYDEPVQDSAQPNLGLLANVLRSDIELHPAVRAWLANLIDPEGSSEAALMFRKRTIVEKSKQLKRNKKFSSDWHVAEFFNSRREAGQTYKQAMFDTCQKFPVSQTIVTNALKSLSHARAERDALVADQLEQEGLLQKKS